MRRISYLNPTYTPVTFGGRFRRYFYGIFKVPYDFLPVYHKKDADDISGMTILNKAKSRTEL